MVGKGFFIPPSFIAHLFLLGLKKVAWRLQITFTIKKNSPAQEIMLAVFRGTCAILAAAILLCSRTHFWDSVLKHIQSGLYTHRFNTLITLYKLSLSAHFNQHSCPQACFNIPKPGTTWNTYLCHCTEACNPALKSSSLSNGRSRSKIHRWNNANTAICKSFNEFQSVWNTDCQAWVCKSYCVHVTVPSLSPIFLLLRDLKFSVTLFLHDVVSDRGCVLQDSQRSSDLWSLQTSANEADQINLLWKRPMYTTLVPAASNDNKDYSNYCFII